MIEERKCLINPYLCNKSVINAVHIIYAQLCNYNTRSVNNDVIKFLQHRN